MHTVIVFYYGTDVAQGREWRVKRHQRFVSCYIVPCYSQGFADLPFFLRYFSGVRLLKAVIRREGNSMRSSITCALALLTLLGCSKVQQKDVVEDSQKKDVEGVTNDVKGWENLRWGMNEKAVREVLGKDVVVGRGDSDNQLKIENVQLFGVEFTAYLNFPEPAKRLVNAVFMATYESVNKYHFDALEKNLILKYGTPSSREDDIKPEPPGAQLLKRSWRFRSTKVGLLFSEIGEQSVKRSVMLVVDYVDANAKKD